MSDGKSEAMEAHRGYYSFTDEDRQRITDAHKRLQYAGAALSMFSAFGSDADLKKARDEAGEAVRAIGEMMTERGM